MNTYILHNASGKRKAFNANTQIEARKMAIAYFNTSIVYFN